MSYEAILAEAKRLDVRDQARLVEEISADLEQANGAYMPSPAIIRELERRLTQHRANPNDVVPWEEVEAEIKAELAK